MSDNAILLRLKSLVGYENKFSDGQPIEEGILYARVFDGNQYCTACNTFTVSGVATATATETTTEVTIDTETTTTEPPTTGGDMTWTIFLILFIILIIGAVVYYFFFMKKKTSKKVKTYEDLYKKWPRRRR